MRHRRSRFSLDDYAQERGNDLYALGAAVDQFVITDLDDEIVVLAQLRFGRDSQAKLTIFEAIEVRDGAARRRKYSYHATYDENFLFRYDRDPHHRAMPEHKHATKGSRVPSGRVTLHDVVDELYTEIRAREGKEQ